MSAGCLRPGAGTPLSAYRSERTFFSGYGPRHSFLNTTSIGHLRGCGPHPGVCHTPAPHVPTAVHSTASISLAATSPLPPPPAPASMTVGTLFIASLLPVLKVAMLCSAGAAMAAKGLLTLEGRRVISALIFNLFTPCLFLDKLGSGVGFKQAIELWPLTFNQLASYALGGLLGVVAVMVTRAPEELRKHIILAIMLGNVGNLPLVLIGSLGDDPALLSLGGAALGMQYIILSNFAGTFLQFPVATMLLRKREPGKVTDSTSTTTTTTTTTTATTTKESDSKAALSTAGYSNGNGNGNGISQSSSPHLPATPVTRHPSQNGYVSLSTAAEAAEPDARGSVLVMTRPAEAVEEQLPETDKETLPLLQPSTALSTAPAAQQQQQQPGQQQQVLVQLWARVRALVSRYWSVLEPTVSSIVSPPTVSCLVGLTVASVPELQWLFFSPHSALRPIGDVVRTFGNMSIPCLMLVLGANLSKGPGVGSIPWRCVMGTIAVRLVILPIVGTGMVLAMRAMGLLESIRPIGVIAMLLNHAVPTAIMVHSMATMYQNREDDVAVLLFWEYMATLVTLPFLLMIFLKLVV